MAFCGRITGKHAGFGPDPQPRAIWRIGNLWSACGQFPVENAGFLGLTLRYGALWSSRAQRPRGQGEETVKYGGTAVVIARALARRQPVVEVWRRSQSSAQRTPYRLPHGLV